ncbi:MAG: VOC family protein [Bryobacteraceae bacterium]|nr:VOC family protein [Bryobacteraceae bacterium]
MSEQMKPGTIGWVDLTVDDAPVLRDFYARVAGWKPEPVSMGGYDDFSMMNPETGTPVAGVCHRRGPNQDLPPVWMIYIIVASIEAALDEVEAAGGTVVKRPAKTGPGSMAVIQDPLGVYSALYQAA